MFTVLHNLQRTTAHSKFFWYAISSCTSCLVTEAIQGCEKTLRFPNFSRQWAHRWQVSNLLLAFASTVILGFRPHHHMSVLSETIYVFWNRDSSYMRRGVGLSATTLRRVIYCTPPHIVILGSEPWRTHDCISLLHGSWLLPLFT
jgi:hypothetical protein